MHSRHNIQHFILLGLAAAIVYPDVVLPWIGARIGRVFVRWHIILFEVLALFVIFATTQLLIPITTHLQWWEPFMYIGAVAFVRLLYWLGETIVRSFFDV